MAVEPSKSVLPKLPGKRLGLIIGLIILVLAVVGGTVYALTRPRLVSDTRASYTVQAGTVVADVSAAGQVQAANQVELSFPAPGTLAYLGVKSGDQVTAGEVLAWEDPEPLQQADSLAGANLSLAQAKMAQLVNPSPQALSAYQTALKNAQTLYADAQQSYNTSLTVAKANYQAAAAALQNDQTQLAQAENLAGWAGSQPILTPAVVAAQNLVVAAKATLTDDQEALDQPTALQSALDTAQAQLQSTQTSYNLAVNPDPNAVAAAQAAVTQAQAAADAAAYNLGKSRIVAPFAGTVAATGFNQGDNVAPDVPAVSLVGSGANSLQVMVRVAQTEIGEVRTGQKATITTSDLPGRVFDGTVIRVNPAATVMEGQATYGVTIQLNTASGLRSGMDATAEIMTGTANKVLVVPVGALQQVGSAWGVYVEREGQFYFQPVRVGLWGGQTVQVKSGLTAGEKILPGTVGGS